jgi:hypothetical protein
MRDAQDTYQVTQGHKAALECTEKNEILIATIPPHVRNELGTASAYLLPDDENLS